MGERAAAAREQLLPTFRQAFPSAFNEVLDGLHDLLPSSDQARKLVGAPLRQSRIERRGRPGGAPASIAVGKAVEAPGLTLSAQTEYQSLRTRTGPPAARRLGTRGTRSPFHPSSARRAPRETTRKPRLWRAWS